MSEPIKHNRGGLKNPRKARIGETIGGGFFVFRRGDGTNRIRPSQWPFEYGLLSEAIREADKLSAANPGYEFMVVTECYTARTEKPADEADAAEAA
jgi:hypothetical protein